MLCIASEPVVDYNRFPFYVDLREVCCIIAKFVL